MLMLSFQTRVQLDKSLMIILIIREALPPSGCREEDALNPKIRYVFNTIEIKAMTRYYR